MQRDRTVETERCCSWLISTARTTNDQNLDCICNQRRVFVCENHKSPKIFTWCFTPYVITPAFLVFFFIFFLSPRTAGLDEETEAIDVAANDLGILGTQGLQALPGMTTQSCKCLGKPMEINGNP